MKILLLSDIHACSVDFNKKLDAPSWVSCIPNTYKDKDMSDPFAALSKLIASQELECDVVLCPGDICDRADSGALTYAWKELNLVREKTKARALLATVGNHDLDTRGKHDALDPKAVLRNLSDRFPLENGSPEIETLRFWADHFAFYEYQNVRFVIVDSCAFHSVPNKTELDRGRISQQTVQKIRNQLDKSDSDRQARDEVPVWMNILVCHHHLSPDSVDNQGDPTSLVGADYVLSELQADHRTWFIIHGHRHRAKLSYSSAASDPIPILGAGSFSAKTGESDYPNQVYMIEFDPSAAKELQVGVAGKIKAWSFVQGAGWTPSPFSAKGIANNSGFGVVVQTQALADRVGKLAKDKPFLEWPELVNGIRELEFITNEASNKIRSKLRSMGYGILPYDGDSKFQVQWKGTA